VTTLADGFQEELLADIEEQLSRHYISDLVAMRDLFQDNSAGAGRHQLIGQASGSRSPAPLAPVHYLADGPFDGSLLLSATIRDDPPPDETVGQPHYITQEVAPGRYRGQLSPGGVQRKLELLMEKGVDTFLPRF